jgi:hypothetical protein
VTKHQGKRPLKRPTNKWKDNIKMYLKETGCVDVDSSGLRQGPVAGSCEYGN